MKEREIQKRGVLDSLRGIFARRQTGPNPQMSVSSIWGLTGAGALVSVDEVLKIPAVLACVRAISETAGMLPFKMVREYEGVYKVATWRDEHLLLSDAPNDYQTADQFRQIMTAAYLLHGDAIAEKEKSLAGTTMALHYIHPNRLSSVFLDKHGVIRYVVDGKELTRDTIYHLPGPCLNGDGYRGESLVARAGESMGLTIAQQQYAASYYGNGATPATILMHPKLLSDPAAKRIEESFNSRFRGPKKSHKFALLEEGMDIKQVGSNAEDAQLIEARREQVIEVCRVFRMPPHLVQSLERATFSNIEEQAREFIEYTMMPHFVRWEKNTAMQLISKEERAYYYWKFSVDSLLRGKTVERYQAYQIAIQNGIYNANECRAKEDANPYQGGDAYIRPLNMQEVAK